MKKISYIVLGILIGVVAANFILNSGSSENEDKPLYWVAPMDSNYRKDKPGLSPMGMALVPVYEEAGVASGIVKISPDIRQNMGVKTALVTEQKLTQNIQTVGYIQYNQNLLAHVHPRVDGWINQLFVKSEGIFVNQGDPLFSLYSPELINAQEEYLLALSRQQNSLIKAAEARLQSLQISERTIKQIKAHKKAQQNIIFYAPQPGVVSRLKVREGFYIQPGNELMTLADLSSVWLEIELTEHKLAWVKKDDQVRMKSMAIPEKTFYGKVDFVYPFLDAKSKTGKVRLAFDNPQGVLKPNMIADIQIVPQQNISALVVPRSAVIRTGLQDRVVWAAGEGHYKSVDVELGQSNNDYFTILSGLKEGDQVVISAQFLIDSESNKMSDFNRFSNLPEAQIEESSVDILQSARTKGLINKVGDKVLNISRDAITKWNRPEATFDFTLDSGIKNIYTQESINESIDFTFEIRGNDFVITEIHQVESETKRD